MPEPIVRLQSVTKRFGDLVAVDDVTLEVLPGEVLALLGENGAGKSTLMKVLYGVYPPDAGQIAVVGAQEGIAGPADAMRHGLGMVFQSFSLLPALSVRDNLLLAWPKTPFWSSRRNRQTAPVLEQLRRLAPHIDPGRPVQTLSVAEQQLVELCKVLNIGARLVILDEPTSVLTPEEARRLHDFIRTLARDGVAVVLITHKLADVEACADRIAIMRRGALVDVVQHGARPMTDIVSMMMGRDVVRRLTPPPRPARHVPRLVLQGISASAPGQRVEDISLSVGRGEIVGVAGVAGNGQTLVAESVAGVVPLAAGDVLLDGVSIARLDPRRPVRVGVGYIPEQPGENAVVAGMSLADNLDLRALAGTGTLTDDGAALLRRFNVVPAEPQRLAATLSGGNLQKLVSARELGRPRTAILACYPTMGLDLSAIEMIYAELFDQAASGAAVLWISEDIDDLLAAAHRIAVMRDGRLVAVLDNDGTLTRDRIGGYMAGALEDAA